VKKVEGKEVKKRVRAALHILIDSPDKDAFDRNYDLLIDQLLQQGPFADFGDYFKRNYPKASASQWAQFGYMGCLIDTNMHLESYHRVIKQKFFNRQCNRRVDFLLQVLIEEISPYYLYIEKRAKVMKNQFTHRKAQASKRHKGAHQYLDNPEQISETEDNVWTIRSLNSRDQIYIVKRNGCKRPLCLVRCKKCGTCAHAYTCSCPDGRFNKSACKHVHTIHMLYPPEEATNMDETLPFVGSGALDDDTLPFLEVFPEEEQIATTPPLNGLPPVVTDQEVIDSERDNRIMLLQQKLVSLAQSLLTMTQNVFTIASVVQKDTYSEEKLNELIAQTEKACTATGDVDRCFRLTQSFDDNGRRSNKRRMTTLQQQSAIRSRQITAAPVSAFAPKPKKSKKSTPEEIAARDALSTRLVTFIDEMDSLRKCPSCNERAASTKDCYKCESCLQWIHNRCIHACQ
jgi:hypothetical protein